MNIYHTHLFLSTLCLLICESHSGSNSINLPKNAPKSIIQKLRNDLLKNYDKEARPIREDGNATEVYFSFYPQYILDLDEENHILSMEAWITLQWTDHHLAWKPRDYERLYSIQFAPHEIWKPDITVYSSIPTASYNPINTDAHILSFSNGEQFWVPPISISSYCDLDYSHYPLDVQTCEVIFGSWTHHRELIDVELAEGEIDVKEFYNTNQVWKVTNTNIKKVIKFFDCCPKSYATVVATLDLKRNNPSIPKRTLKGPSLLAIFFTLLMFWLPSTSCQKINLGCASFIILSICLVYIGKTAKSSMVIFATANSIQSLLYIVATALLMEVIIVNLARTSGPWKPPYFFTNLLRAKVGKFMLIVIPKKQHGLMDDVDANSEEEGSPAYPSDTADDWFVLGAAIDRILFTVYLLAFVVHFSITGL